MLCPVNSMSAPAPVCAAGGKNKGGMLSRRRSAYGEVSMWIAIKSADRGNVEVEKSTEWILDASVSYPA